MLSFQPLLRTPSVYRLAGVPLAFPDRRALLPGEPQSTDSRWCCFGDDDAREAMLPAPESPVQQLLL
jgi:hypothetical protein